MSDLVGEKKELNETVVILYSYIIFILKQLSIMNFKIKDLEGFNISKGENTIDVYDELTRRIENITYVDLVTKKENGKLIPGKYYRITDYVTTTTQEGTQSAGHQFDIIVLALDDHTLSEDAKAALHEGDTYFSGNNCKLESWELKYTTENDTEKFAWVQPSEKFLYIGQYSTYIYSDPEDPTSEIVGVDTTSYTGVSQTRFKYTGTGQIDETQTEYDVFVAEDYSSAIALPGGTETFDDTIGNNPGENPLIPRKFINLDSEEYSPYLAPVVKIYEDGGKGVIYYMKDEWNNECPYDFKNIQFTRKMTDGEFDATNGVDTYVYTFTWVDTTGKDPEIIDCSVLNRELNINNSNNATYLCDNKILSKVFFPYNNNNICRYSLANNVFICYYDEYWGDLNMTSDNYIGGISKRNTFVGDANHNRLNGDCYENIFYRATSNYLTNTNNSDFDENCSSNIITNSRFIELGQSSQYNRISNSYTIYFGDNSDNNDINLSSDVSFGEYNSNNRVSNSDHITFDKNYTHNIEIDYCGSVTLTTSQTTSNSNILRNIKILRNTTSKTITHPTVNDSGLTIYRANNVREVTV